MSNTKNIDGYGETYVVSDDGDIMVVHHLKKMKNKSDSEYVSLKCEDGTYTQRPVHMLVANAFMDDYVKGKHVRHRDGNRSNNSVDNLFQ